MRDKNIFDRDNLDILTENKGTEVLNKRSALKTRICAFITLLVVCIFTAVFGFIWNFAPINTTDNDKDNAAYAATAAEEWTSIIQAGGGTFTLQSDWVAPSGSFGTRTSDGFRGGALNIQDGVNVTLDLNGHTINRNLTAVSAYGAVIYVGWGSVLTVKDSVGGGKITGGWNSTGSNYAGGGIGLYESATLNFESGIITGNKTTADYSGGAIALRTGSVLNMTGGVLSENSTAGGYGGAISIFESAATISNAQIINNTSSGSYSAGGISVRASTQVTVSNCNISGNTNTNTGNYTAGGIYLYYESACTISNSTISNNSALGTRCGGGATAYSSCTLNVTGGSITGNIASGSNTGGGVYLQSDSSATFTSCNISGNKGGYSGGVFVATGCALKIGGSIQIENNTTTSDSSTANVKFASTAMVENTTDCIQISSALQSGAHVGITKTGNNYDFSLARVTNGLKDTTNSAAMYFFADQAPDYEIRSQNGEAVVYTFINEKNWDDACVASANGNGAVQTFILYSDWTASSSGFGTTRQFSNGGLYVNGTNIILDLNGHTLNRNLRTAIASGYVIHVRGTLKIIDSVGGGVITGGNSSDGTGGGIYIASDSTVNMSAGTITGNSCAVNGGGVFAYYGAFNMTGGTITGNTAANGGGVYIGGSSNNATFNMSGGVIKGNNASAVGGGVYVYNNKTFSISGSACVYENTNGSNPSNVYLENNTQLITISAPLTATHKTGVSRGLIGTFTTGWATHMNGVAPEDYFKSDSEDMLVVTYSTGEGAFLSTNNAENWENAVKTSISESNTQTVKLSKDWIAVNGDFGFSGARYFSDGGLFVHSDASIILDLNGHKIDRQSFNTERSSPIIKVYGKLEIIDSSVEQTGAIMNNFSNFSSSSGSYLRGGGISIYNGTCIMRAGTITNCRVNNGGAGAVHSYNGTFTMYGGTIEDCSTTTAGGAGGVYMTYAGAFNFFGGSIKNCTATYSTRNVAGGVFISSDCALNVSGTVKICDNFLSDGTGSDVFLADGNINIVGKLLDDARIGIRREVNNYATPNGNIFTNGFSKYNTGVDPISYFFASEDKRHVVLSGGTEGRLWCIDNATNWTNCYNNGGGEIILYSDWVATGGVLGTGNGFTNGALYINNTVTLDLNGYTIDRRLTSATAGGGGNLF